MQSLHYYTQQQKEKVKLSSKPFASGGEGQLFKISTPSRYQNFVAKIYHPNKLDAERHKKLVYLINNPPKGALQKGSNLIWPQDLLFDQNGQFVGFIMPFIKAQKLETLSLSKLPRKLGHEWKRFDRKNKQSQELRLRLCYNIATIVYTLHATGHYRIVDLKPDNILVQPNGIVSLVDIDSIEIIENGKIKFPATVITPEFTPPEYYLDYPSAKIPTQYESWDLFSLGVVLYKLLFGIHPFAATAGSPYQDVNNLHEKIKHGLFVHNVSLRPVFRVVPPPHKGFDEVDEMIRELFYNCFINGHKTPNHRPSASEWAVILKNIISGTPLLHEKKNIEEWYKEVWSSWYEPLAAAIQKNTLSMKVQPEKIKVGDVIDIETINTVTQIQFPTAPSIAPKTTIHQLERLENKEEAKSKIPFWLIGVVLGLLFIGAFHFIFFLINLGIGIALFLTWGLRKAKPKSPYLKKMDAILTYFKLSATEDFQELRKGLENNIEHQKSLLKQRVKGLQAKVDAFKKSKNYATILKIDQQVRKGVDALQHWSEAFEATYKEKLIQLRNEEITEIDGLYKELYKNHIEPLQLDHLNADQWLSYSLVHSKILRQYPANNRGELLKMIQKQFDIYMERIREVEAKYHNLVTNLCVQAKAITEEYLRRSNILLNQVKQQHSLLRQSTLQRDIDIFEQRKANNIQLIERHLVNLKQYEIAEQWLSEPISPSKNQ